MAKSTELTVPIKASLTNKKTRDKLKELIRYTTAGNQARAYQMLGINKSTYMTYMRAHPEFKAEVDQAVAKAEKIHNERVELASREAEDILMRHLRQINLDPEKTTVKDVVEIVKLLRKEHEKVQARNVTNIQNNINLENLSAEDLKTLMEMRAKITDQSQETDDGA